MSSKEQVLVCLLSEQLIPNLLSIHTLNPDRLALVATRRMQEEKGAERLLKALKCGGADYEGRYEVWPLESHKSVTDVTEVLNQGSLSRPDAEWMVNVAGGTKIMAIAAYQFFNAKGARLYYVDVQNPGDVISLSDGKLERSSHRLTCKEFLACYGFSDNDTAKAEKIAEWFFPLSQEIARSGRDGIQFNLGSNDKEIDRARNKLRDGKLKLPAGAIRLTSDALRTAFELELENRKKPQCPPGLGEFELQDDSITGLPDKYTGEFLTGNWLEVFIYGMLRKHADALMISDVRIGLKPTPADPAADRKNPEPNELDVTFVREYSLCAVECKTGMKHDKKFNALYKLVAVMAQNQALRKRVYFATTDEVIYDNDKKASGAENSASVPTGDEPVKKFVEGRAALYGMKLLTPKRIRDLASASSDEEELKLLEEALQ